MKHSDKDIEAAESFRRENVGTLDGTLVMTYLAGCEHKQKDIDELVEAIRDRIEDVYDDPVSRLNQIDKLIQKYKR